MTKFVPAALVLAAVALAGCSGQSPEVATATCLATKQDYGQGVHYYECRGYRALFGALAEIKKANQGKPIQYHINFRGTGMLVILG